MTLAELLLQKGREEALHKTAINFLKLGVSAEQISQATSLSLQEINPSGANGHMTLNHTK